MDEHSKQLIAEVCSPVLPEPGTVTKEDFEHIRHGMCVAWMFVESLAGWRKVPVRERKTAVEGRYAPW